MEHKVGTKMPTALSGAVQAAPTTMPSDPRSTGAPSPLSVPLPPVQHEIDVEGILSIHPLFHQNKFPSDIDYDNGFRRPALLASRLLSSPQSYHFFFGMFFGKNTAPEGIPRAVQVPSKYTVPQNYASDKGIDDISEDERPAVRWQLVSLADRITWQITELESDGQCHPLKEKPGVRGCDSIIKLARRFYRLALDKGRPKEESACIDLYIAKAMIHEVAHAAAYAVLGNRCEDYFEDSLVAEAGFELECRIFGMVSQPTSWGEKSPFGLEWESYPTLIWQQRGYELSEICYHEAKLARKSSIYLLEGEFALKLCDDGFWKGEYLERGAFALIPAPVAKMCNEGVRSKVYKNIPRSIRHLFKTGVRSYAQRKYAHLANPEFNLRNALAIVPVPESTEEGDQASGGK